MYGNDVRVEVDRTDGGNGGTGLVRFFLNEKPLVTEPLPIGFAQEAVLVVCFGFDGGGAKIVSFK